MTKEQEEAIERCKKIITTKFNLDYSIDNYDKEAIETVLNMLKEKDAEIEKKDKQIEELIKYIDSNNYLDNEECQFQWDFKIEKCIGNGDCKECIKQYFEKQLKEK